LDHFLSSSRLRSPFLHVLYFQKDELASPTDLFERFSNKGIGKAAKNCKPNAVHFGPAGWEVHLEPGAGIAYRPRHGLQLELLCVQCEPTRIAKVLDFLGAQTQTPAIGAAIPVFGVDDNQIRHLNSSGT
jgi:hypothetical protein